MVAPTQKVRKKDDLSFFLLCILFIFCIIFLSWQASVPCVESKYSIQSFTGRAMSDYSKRSNSITQVSIHNLYFIIELRKIRILSNT